MKGGRFSFTAPQRGMLRFVVDPSFVDPDFFTIGISVKSEDRREQREEQLIRKYGGIQAFNSPVANAGDLILWYDQDIIGNIPLQGSYLLYLEFIPFPD